MISLVASTADSNAAGASSFCGFTQPLGVQNGDLVLVCLALPAAGVTVTPPSSDWVQLAPQTDPTQALGLVAFYTMALNLPSSIVFSLSSSTQVTGSLMVYRGTETFTPVEVSAAQLTAAAVSHGVAGVTAALAGDEAVLFIAGAGSGTYTPVGNFQLVTRKQQANCTLEAQHKGLPSAGVIASFNETFSASVAGASLLMVLSPSPGNASFQDAYDRVFEALPSGIDNILDFTPNEGHFWKFTWAIGALLKLYWFDLLDIAETELIAFQSRYKLPNWEAIFGLALSRAAKIGTIPQRQQQVLGAWRAAAGQTATASLIKATIGPLLGYSTTISTVVESDVSALALTHSYGFFGDVSIANLATGTAFVGVYADGGKCSSAGARLTLVFSAAPIGPITVVLTGPSGDSVTWTGTWSGVPVQLYAPAFTGKPIQGIWKIAVTNNSGATITLYDGSRLYVEGMGRSQQTGGAIFEWGVAVDWAHIGESGSPADFAAARLAIKKLAQSHSTGNLIQSSDPWPDTDSGPHASIPDECTPV